MDQRKYLGLLLGNFGSGLDLVKAKEVGHRALRRSWRRTPQPWIRIVHLLTTRTSQRKHHRRQRGGEGDTVKAKAVSTRLLERVPDAQLVIPPEVPAVDFQDCSSVRVFAAALMQQRRPVHILVNNAATSRLPKGPGQVAPLAQANYLCPWLLVHLLEPLLIESRARVVFVSSVTSRTCSILDPVKFMTNANYCWYKHTKLAQVINAFELQRRLGRKGVQVCAVDPGLASTSVWESTVFSLPPIKQIINQVAAPAQDAAVPVVHAATVPWDTDVEPGIPPEEDLRFYARGLFCSPLVSGLDGSWSSWLATPRWAAWGSIAALHAAFDYPLRNWLGACSKVQVVPGPPQAYDKQLAATLWQLSEHFIDVSAADQGMPQHQPGVPGRTPATGRAAGLDETGGVHCRGAAAEEDEEGVLVALSATELASVLESEVLGLVEAVSHLGPPVVFDNYLGGLAGAGGSADDVQPTGAVLEETVITVGGVMDRSEIDAITQEVTQALKEPFEHMSPAGPPAGLPDLAAGVPSGVPVFMEQEIMVSGLTDPSRAAGPGVEAASPHAQLVEALEQVLEPLQVPANLPSYLASLPDLGGALVQEQMLGVDLPGTPDAVEVETASSTGAALAASNTAGATRGGAGMAPSAGTSAAAQPKPGGSKKSKKKKAGRK